jgi:hypothetical protein
VLPVFELNFNKPDQRQPHNAVDLAWQFACGENPSPQTVEGLEKKLGDVLKVMNESNDLLDAAKDVCMGTIYLLDTIIGQSENKSADHAARSVGFAHEAVQYFEDYAGPGGEEEIAIQEKALQLTELWKNKPIERAMFKELTATPPAWRDAQG